MDQAGECQSYGRVTDDDHNRFLGVCSRDVNHLCLLAPVAEDLGLEVRWRRIDGDADHIFSRRLPLVSVWIGAPILAHHSDEFRYADYDGSNFDAQVALSRITGC
jgi:hypothetical protein